MFIRQPCVRRVSDSGAPKICCPPMRQVSPLFTRSNNFRHPLLYATPVSVGRKPTHTLPRCMTRRVLENSFPEGYSKILHVLTRCSAHIYPLKGSAVTTGKYSSSFCLNPHWKQRFHFCIVRSTAAQCTHVRPKSALSSLKERRTLHNRTQPRGTRERPTGTSAAHFPRR